VRANPELDLFVVRVAEEVAARLTSQALIESWTRIGEQRHLQPVTAAVARELAQQTTPAIVVGTAYPLRADEWPLLGPGDLALTVNENGAPAIVELKAGSDRNALGPCSWDALKLAFLLQRGLITAGYLLAVAPLEIWSGKARGYELFETSEVETLELHETFKDWFRYWERQGYPAGTTVPARFRTLRLTYVQFPLSLTKWELRAAAVKVTDGEQLAWALEQAAPPTEASLHDATDEG
jgi:hypothetical protein